MSACGGIDRHGTCPFLATALPELGGRCEGCHELHSIDVRQQDNTCPVCLRTTNHGDVCPSCARSIHLTTKTLRGERVA